MKWFRKKLQDWLGITLLADRVVEHDLLLAPLEDPTNPLDVVKGYDTE